jgi:hypothetical protein
MKIDIEGSEPYALIGMNTMFRAKRIQNFVIESNTPDLLEVFFDIGYRCRVYDEKCPGLKAPECRFETYKDVLNQFDRVPKAQRPKGYFDIFCSLEDTSVSWSSMVSKEVAAFPKGTTLLSYGDDIFELLPDQSSIKLVASGGTKDKNQARPVQFRTMFLLSMVV